MAILVYWYTGLCFNFATLSEMALQNNIGQMKTPHLLKSWNEDQSGRWLEISVDLVTIAAIVFICFDYI